MSIPPVRRVQPQVATENVANMSEEEKQQKAQEIINGAPLQSNPDDVTNPPAEEKVKAARPAKPKVKPWRIGFQDRPVSELMQIKSKTSFTQIKEIELRLEFILSEANNNRGLGPKVYMNQLIHEALNDLTVRKLKELGYDVD